MHWVSYPMTWLFVCLYGTCVLAQKPVVKTEERKDGYQIIATNPGYLPVSLTFEWQLTNLRVEGGRDTVVVAPQASRVIYRLVRVNDRQGTSYRFTYVYATGDYRAREYDADHVYELPYRGPEARRVMQGYDGAFSHQDKAALDFDLPEGTRIYAARSGRVVETVAGNDTGCPDPVCTKFNNLVRVLHDDGTIAEYAHLRKNGVAVKLGQKVKTGDLLGYSGNTGFSTGPHLHFAVYQERFGRRIFLPTPFRTEAGTSLLLVEGESYMSGPGD